MFSFLFPAKLIVGLGAGKGEEPSGGKSFARFRPKYLADFRALGLLEVQPGKSLSVHVSYAMCKLSV
jgi:hypothetical protein